MPNLHFGELLLVLLIVLIIFGAGRLPMIGEGLGKAIKNFKRSVTGRDEIEVKRMSDESSAETLPRRRSRGEAKRSKPRVEEPEAEDEEAEAEEARKPSRDDEDDDAG